jgi:hypothetical protein
MPSTSRRSGERRNSPSAAWSNCATYELAPLPGRMAWASERAVANVRCLRLTHRRAAASSNVLANQIVQVSTDAKAEPSITIFTTISADQNMPHGVRSRAGSTGVAPAGAR